MLLAITDPVWGKAQSVRLVDVILLGPFMIWAGVVMMGDDRPSSGAVMVASGVATIAFNLRNYLELRSE